MLKKIDPVPILQDETASDSPCTALNSSHPVYLQYTLKGFEDGLPFEKIMYQELDRWAAQSADTIDVTISSFPLASLEKKDDKPTTKSKPIKARKKKSKHISNSFLKIEEESNHPIPECFISVRLHQSAKIFIGGQIWDTSFILACWSFSRSIFNVQSLNGIEICEVGAGIGFLSIVFAALGAKVTSTDLPEVIPILQRNIQDNDSTILQYQGINSKEGPRYPVQIKSLDWRNPCLGSFTSKFDYIFACDCIYSEAATVDLVHCLVKLCKLEPKAKQTVVYVVSEVRNEEVQQVFREEAERFFQVQLVNVMQIIYPFIPPELRTSTIRFYQMVLLD